MMILKSPAFEHGGSIPAGYTCEGEDISPPLIWENIPEGTITFALISDDPDAPAGTWVHWIYYNIPAAVRLLPADIPPVYNPDIGGQQGKTASVITDTEVHAPGRNPPLFL